MQYFYCGVKMKNLKKKKKRNSNQSKKEIDQS